MPPGDIIDRSVSTERLEALLPKQTIFITVMARDNYGLEIRRQVFLPSNEFRISSD
jgi:hypothetical protein